MTETNGHYVESDLDRVIHALHLRMTGMASELAEKDRSENTQIRMMLSTIGKFIGAQLKPLKDEIAGLKAQVDELKRKGISYKGIYQRSCAYEVGSMVSHDHSVWACIEDAAVNELPGSHPSKWQMALRGDGREQRLPTKGGARPETIMQRRT